MLPANPLFNFNLDSESECHPPVFCESNAGFFTILYFSHGFVVLELTSFIRGASWFTQRGKYKNCSKGDSPRRLDSEPPAKKVALRVMNRGATMD